MRRTPCDGLNFLWSGWQGLSWTNVHVSIATWSYVGEGETILTKSSDILFHGFDRSIDPIPKISISSFIRLLYDATLFIPPKKSFGSSSVTAAQLFIRFLHFLLSFSVRKMVRSFQYEHCWVRWSRTMCNVVVSKFKTFLGKYWRSHAILPSLFHFGVISGLY